MNRPQRECGNPVFTGRFTGSEPDLTVRSIALCGQKRLAETNQQESVQKAQRLYHSKSVTNRVPSGYVSSNVFAKLVVEREVCLFSIFNKTPLVISHGTGENPCLRRDDGPLSLAVVTMVGIRGQIPVSLTREMLHKFLTNQESISETRVLAFFQECDRNRRAGRRVGPGTENEEVLFEGGLPVERFHYEKVVVKSLQKDLHNNEFQGWTQSTRAGGRSTFERVAYYPVWDCNEEQMDHCNTLNGTNGEATNDDDLDRASKSLSRQLASAKWEGNVKNGQKRRLKKRLAQVGNGVLRQLPGGEVLVELGGVNTIGRLAKRGLKLAAKGLKKTKGKRRQVSRVPRGIGSKVLSKQCAKYLLANIDPFHPAAKSAYVPVFPSASSQKVTGFARGTYQCGNSVAWNFICGVPVLANNVNAYWCTQAGAASSPANFAMPTASNANGIYGIALSNLPYTYAQMTGTTAGSIIEGRVVSAMIRIRPVMAPQVCNGLAYAYADPNNDSILGLNCLDLGKFMNTEVFPVAPDSWCFTYSLPSRASQMSYHGAADTVLQVWPYSTSTTTDPTSSGTTTVATPTFGLNIGPMANNGGAFYYEIIEHVEYYGSGVPQSLMTPTEADIVGYDRVQCVLSRARELAAADSRLTLKEAVLSEMSKEGYSFQNIASMAG